MSLNRLVICDYLYSCTFVCWHSWNGTWDVWEPSPGISKNDGKLYILLQLVHGVWICTNEIHSDSIAMCELMMLFLIATPCLKNFRTVRPNKQDPCTKAFLFAWPGQQWLHHITPLVKSEQISVSEMLPTCCRYRRNTFATPDVLAPLEASPDAEATDVHEEPLVLHPDCFG